MKITDKRKANLIPFGKLKNGEVFEYEDEIYMKLSETVRDASGVECNTVHLSDGVVFPFEDNYGCIYIHDTELIINY